MASSMLNLAASRATPLGTAGSDALCWKRGGAPARLLMRVRASTVNPSIKKDVDKVVDSVEVADLDKKLTPYCRCWRSEKFPLCDGSHMKHNKETGDNVGPLLIKKAGQI